MSSSASKYFEIPKFFVFGEKGIFSGSAAERDFNYKVVPNCPKEGEKSLRAYIWSGNKCIDKSEGVIMREFALSEDGHAEMLNWLESEYLSREETVPDYVKRQEFARKICDEYVSLEDYTAKRR
ncbi:MAG: hypothetical protein NC120_09570 [Ruminococcus sp.]|nr:hypothetical protein [Ruminococcus sp.]